MTIRTAAEALVIANGTRVNVVGTCQKVTRGYYLAPSAGDVDRDGDADAYDGWLSEPKSARHAGDRNPPAGYPVAFRSNNGTGHGHRAISLGKGMVRSTDFDGLTKRYRAGVLGNGTIAQVERAMNATYLGWSETIDGIPIPKPAPAKPEEKPMPSPSTPPAAHTHLVEQFDAHSSISLHDVSAVEQAQRDPWHTAAYRLHVAVNKAWDEYEAATKKK